MANEQENTNGFSNGYLQITTNGNKKDKKELTKQGSTGSTDSDDVSENDSSASNNSWSGEVTEPTNQLLFTNMDQMIFYDRELMDIFESMIHKYDPDAKIFYFKSFSRARVDMCSVVSAATAKEELHDLQCGNRIMKCYYFRDLLLGRRNSDHLEPPPLDKQFLISPPASPPVGWEPVHEGEPVIDYDLLAALASLQPGETHELHPGAEEKNIPAIVLQPCHETVELRPMVTVSADLSDDEDSLIHRPAKIPKVAITQTRRPPIT